MVKLLPVKIGENGAREKIDKEEEKRRSEAKRSEVGIHQLERLRDKEKRNTSK